MPGSPIHQCPHCHRHIRVDTNRYVVHSIEAKQMHRCPLSDQRVVVTGLSDTDHEHRARTVLDLAEQVQDADPALVWTYLTALPKAELQRLMVIALAGLPVDQHEETTWRWVYRLPAAQQWTEPEPAQEKIA